MNTYEDFPFWNTLLVECGFKVQLSDASSSELFRKGAGTVMSENICFPAKLVHGHIQNLIEKGVDRIFYPMVFAEHQKFADAINSFNCPIVTGYPDVVRSAIDPAGKHSIPLDMPLGDLQGRKAAAAGLLSVSARVGCGEAQRFQRAFERALAPSRNIRKPCRRKGRKSWNRPGRRAAWSSC